MFSKVCVQFIIFLIVKVWGMTYDGLCPEMPDSIKNSKLSCKNFVGNISFESLYVAQSLLPVNGIVSIFTTDWELNCSGFEIKCSPTSDSFLSLRHGCWGVANVQSGFGGPPASLFQMNHYTREHCFIGYPVLTCMSVVYDTEIKPKVQQIKTFGTLNPSSCPQQRGNFTLYSILRENFFVIYGCMDLPETNQHEEGIWILIKDGRVALIPDEMQENFPDIVLEMLPGTSATKSNFITADLRNINDCKCPPCTITSKCPTLKDDEEDEYDGYIDFSMDNYQDYN